MNQRSVLTFILGGMAALSVILLQQPLASRVPGAELVLAWVTCLIVFALADFMANDVENGLWFAYRHLAVMTAWLSLGALPALGVALTGSVVGLCVRLVQRKGVPWTVYISAQHWLAAAAALAAAQVVYRLGAESLGAEAASQFGLAAALLVMHGLRFIYSIRVALPETNWFMETLLAVAAPALAYALMQLGGVYFAVLMGLVAAQILRYRQVRQAALAIQRQTQQLSALENDTTVLRDRSTEMARSLSLINIAVQEVMFNLDGDDALITACRTAAQITQTTQVAIFIRDDERMDRLILKTSIGLLPEQIALYSQPDYLPSLKAPHTLVVVDTETLPHGDVHRALGRRAGFRSMLRIVLRSGNTPFGAMLLLNAAPRIYQKTELELLETLAFQVSAALDNAALLKALEQYAGEQAQLVHLSRVSNASLNLEMVLDSVSALLEQMIEVDQASVGLLHPDGLRIAFWCQEASGRRTVMIADAPELETMVRQKHPTPRIFYRGEDRLSATLDRLAADRDAVTLALVPMVANSTLLGVVALFAKDERIFTDNQWRHAELAANQVALQIHNAQRFGEIEQTLERRLRQLVAIEEVAQRITSALSEDILVKNVLEAALNVTQADIVDLGLLTPSGEFRIVGVERRSEQWVPHEVIRPIGYGVMGQVFLTGRAVLLPHNRAHPAYVNGVGTIEYQSSLVVPLLREDVVFGALNVESVQPEFFRDEHLEFLTSLAGHAVIAIQNVRLLEERQRQIETLILLRELSLGLSADPTRQQVAEAILKTSLAIMHGTGAALLHYDAATRELRSTTALQRVDASIERFQPTNLPIPARTALWVANTGSVEVLEDIHPDEHYLAHAPGTPVPYRSMVFAPLKYGGQVQAVLCIALAEQRVFTEDALNTVELLAIQAAGHLENNALLDQIHASSNRMRAILESTREGIILLDTEGRLVEANASAERLLNIELETYLNYNFARALAESARRGGLQEQETQDALTEMARVLRLEPRRITTRSLEMRKSGGTRYITEVGSPVYDIHDPSVVMGRLLTLRDVTEEKLLASYRDEITKMAVHDLRSPLSTVISGLTLAMDIFATDIPDHEIKPIITETLETATTNAQRLLALVESILEISRMESRRMPLLREVVVLGELFKAVFISLSAMLQENDLTLEVVIPPDLPPVYVDSDKIRRVLINLLDNAVRYSPEHGKILLSAALVDGKVRVEVADSGKGIPPEERERIFDKFTQIKENVPLRGFKGAGLGLAFCKLVLEAHGERIWVDGGSSLPGACFVMTLPLVSAEGEPAAIVESGMTAS